MTWLVLHMWLFLALALLLGCALGWLLRNLGESGQILTLRGERDAARRLSDETNVQLERLRARVTKVDGVMTLAAPDAALEQARMREAEAVREIHRLEREMGDLRLGFEGELSAARARIVELETLVREHGGDREELHRLTDRVRELESAALAMPIATAETVESDPTMAWKTRYLESRVATLSTALENLPPLPAATAMADEGEPMGSPDEQSVWRARYYQGRATHLEGLLAEAEAHAAALVDSAGAEDELAAANARVVELESTLMTAETQLAESQAALSALRAEKEIWESESHLTPDDEVSLRKLGWRMNYFEARTHVLETTALAMPQAPSVDVEALKAKAFEAETALAARLQDIEALRAHTSALETQLSAKVQEGMRQIEELNGLRLQVNQYEARFNAKSLENAAQLNELNALRARASQFDQGLAASRGELEALRIRARELESQLTARNTEALAARTRLSDLETLLGARVAEVHGLQARLAEAQTTLAGRSRDSETAKSDAWKTRYLESRVSTLTAALAAKPLNGPGAMMPPMFEVRPSGEPVRPPALNQPRNGLPDDLKMIGGIGPKIESVLHKLGIYHFDQIVAWTPQNIAWIEHYLEFKGRVAREHWLEQAHTLAGGGTTPEAMKYLSGEHI